MKTDRRGFLRESCKLCASIVGISLVASSLEGCAPLNYYSTTLSNGELNIPIASFIENSNMVIIKDKSLEYQVAVVKQKDNTFKAFELKCTHQDNSLIATKSSFVCGLHGSTFDLSGKVITTPASKNLKEFPVTLSNDLITVKYN